MTIDGLRFVGTGLMGASVGLAARAGGHRAVFGYDPDAEAARAGRSSAAPWTRSARARRGARRSRPAPSWPRPSRTLPAVVEDVLARAPESCTVTDVGSTKDWSLRLRRTRFVGGHPVCGREARGPAHARGRPLRRRDLVPDAGGRDRPRPLPARPRLRRLARRRPGRDRPAGARPARRAHEPPAARAREPARQPGGRGAHRGSRSAGGGRRIAPRHDARRRREPADLGRHLPRQRRRAGRGAGRAPPPGRAARGRACRRRRRLPRPLDGRGLGEPAADARGRLRGPGRRSSA